MSCPQDVELATINYSSEEDDIEQLRLQALTVMNHSIQDFLKQFSDIKLANNLICLAFLEPEQTPNDQIEDSTVLNLTDWELVCLVHMLIVSNLRAHCSLLPSTSEAEEESDKIYHLLQILKDIQHYSNENTHMECVMPVLQHFETSLQELIQAISENFIDTRILDLLINEYEQRFENKGVHTINNNQVTLGFCQMCCLETRILLIRHCGCKACVHCVQKWINTKVTAKQTSIPCIQCSSEYSEEESILLLGREAHRMQQLIDRSTTINNKSCPNCSTVTQQPYQVLSSSVIKCKTCNFNWCFNCHGPQHESWSCSQNKDTDFLLEQWSQQRVYDNPRMLRARRCPNPSGLCSVMIEKNEGCNHMTCTNCHYEFCYLCGGPWSDLCACDISDSFLWTGQLLLVNNGRHLESEEEDDTYRLTAANRLCSHSQIISSRKGRTSQQNKLERFLRCANKFFCCKL